MEKFKRSFLLITEALLYLLVGTALIYLPWILSEKAALHAMTHPRWQGMDGWILLGGYIMAIFEIGIIFEHCKCTCFWLMLLAFLMAPWMDLLMSFQFGIGNPEDAAKLICISLFDAFIAGIGISAESKARAIYGPYWKFPSGFKK